jgi:hypothetical protein
MKLSLTFVVLVAAVAAIPIAAPGPGQYPLALSDYVASLFQ